MSIPKFEPTTLGVLQMFAWLELIASDPDEFDKLNGEERAKVREAIDLLRKPL